MDSATLRLSVGEKIKRLSQNINVAAMSPEAAVKRRSGNNFGARTSSTELKTASLPKDATPPTAENGIFASSTAYIS